MSQANNPTSGPGQALSPARPASGQAPGSARPASDQAPGSARPASGQAPGSARPTPGQAPGSARPASGQAPGSARSAPGQADNPPTSNPPSLGRPDDQAPKWVREIQRFLGVKSQFVLWGNVHDVYPIVVDGQVSVGTLEIYLQRILADLGYRFFFRLEPYRFAALMGDPKSINLDLPRPDEVVTLGRATDLAAQIVALNQPAALMIQHGSRLADLCESELARFQYELFRLSINGKARDGRFNLIFWVMDKENDLPAWYSLDNPRVRVLPIPRPGHDIRRQVILAVGSLIKGYKSLAAEDLERHWSLVNRFIDLTAGLFASELISIVSLAARDGLPFPRIAEAARQYKLGVAENPWAKL
ncbi:MAG: hypothetical protein LBE01_01745, partial [Deltaproteobacteria bacterium]|nr:hypothetical protein [Deltaproteobacteria bacterium]